MPGKKVLIAVGIVIFIVFIVVLVLSLGGSGDGRTSTNQPSGLKKISDVFKRIPILNQIVKTDSGAFFATSITQPFGELTLNDIPAYFDITNVVKDGNTIWFAGNGFILEYDTVKKAVVGSSVRKNTGDCADVALAGGFLYAACDVRGIDQYKASFTGFENNIHNYVVFKINPKSNEIVKVFTPKDGLKSTVSYRLFADAADIWVTSVGGVARIQPDETVSFFDKQLAINGSVPSPSQVVADGTHIWVISAPTDHSKGGVSVFDKQTNGWLGFDPDDLQEREREKIDVEGFKIIPGGVQIAFRDGRINLTVRLVEKQYNYTSGIWKKISDMPTTGDGGIGTYAYLRKSYPQRPVYTEVDGRGFSQLRLPTTGQSYPTNGRRSYIFSEMINGKRYLLTSASIDVLEPDSPFNRVLVPLGEGLELSQIYPSLESYQTLVRFVVEPQSMLGLVVDTACDPRLGCQGKQKAWLVDLNNGKLLRAYTAVDGLPGGKLLNGLTLSLNGTTLSVYNKLGIRLFAIDTTTNTLTPFVSPAPTTTPSLTPSR